MVCHIAALMPLFSESFSTHVNPVFAQQGYFTVAINPTGSTTFGQGMLRRNFNLILLDAHSPTAELTDAIIKDWGGKPYIDLQKGWKYILDQYPEIDPDRTVGAGASYGGYAIK